VPKSVSPGDPEPLAKYNKRLVVPEPDRFYSHGAGKPLLQAIVSIPQLALINLIAKGDRNLLYYQYHYNYHPIFILTRLVQILAGLVTVLLVYRFLLSVHDTRKALLGAAIMAFFPVTIQYFPNIHHDSILVPFMFASAYLFSRQKYAWAGLCLGLALASKNAAIVLPIVFFMAVAGELWQERRQETKTTEKPSPGRRITGLATTLLLALVVLLPFASPVSYVEEILTPLTDREFDHRGEDISKYTLSGQLATTGDETTSPKLRPEVQMLRSLLHLQHTGFFFMAIAILVLLQIPRAPLIQISFLVLLFSIPLGLVFGYYLNYRALMYVPFFTVLCVAVASNKHLLGFAILLLAVDIVYCIDPITTNLLHTTPLQEPFWAVMRDLLVTD